MERSGYFPLCGDTGTPGERELVQVQRVRGIVDPQLPPILQGEHVHGTSLRHRIGAILKTVAAWLLGIQGDAACEGDGLCE